MGHLPIYIENYQLNRESDQRISDMSGSPTQAGEEAGWTNLKSEKKIEMFYPPD